MDTTRGIIIAAPASGSGKTLITLGLLAALRAGGLAVAPAKIGPDYIDPAFHAAASGRNGATIDSWAMSPATLSRVLTRAGQNADVILCEGVMGLMDGAARHQTQADDDQRDGSTAEIARLTGWPVILVVDCTGMAASAVAQVAGFTTLGLGLTIAGVIFNRVGSPKHRAMIETAMRRHLPDIVLLGFVPPLAALTVPSRHLGLVQASEHPDLAGFLAAAAAHMANAIDLDRLIALAQPHHLSASPAINDRIPPLGSRIAVAQDAAFAFVYPDLLADWRDQGAEISFFSPLGNQCPDASCDAVYLPGGYPELHAPTLSASHDFLRALQSAARRGTTIYGECGGYMVLGQALIDQHGRQHSMAGLLPMTTSIRQPQRHLGYRQVRLRDSHPFGPPARAFRGHEFHYASEVEGNGVALWEVEDASGSKLCSAGHQKGSVSGSFIHLISIL